MGDTLQTSVRAKMVLAAVNTSEYGGGIKQTKLRFECRYDDSIPEDRRFQKATPTGVIEMQIDNPMALGQFKVGESYYVDFTNAPKQGA